MFFFYRYQPKIIKLTRRYGAITEMHANISMYCENYEKEA